MNIWMFSMYHGSSFELGFCLLYHSNVLWFVVPETQGNTIVKYITHEGIGIGIATDIPPY